MWRPGSKLLHPFNPELGIGVVRAIDGRFLVVHFPGVDQEFTLAAEGSGLHRLVLPGGARARLVTTGEDVIISEALGHRYRLSDGREVDDLDIWPLGISDSPVERLAGLRLDSAESFCNRLAGLQLMTLREAGGLGSFLGGRIELFPHQLHTALRAVRADPVRWLLADEVGLGKTVEACLVLSALLRTGRAQRALVVAPSTLAVQWLGELYRKFHQVFVLLDHARLEAVETDFGEGVNPFDVHPFAVLPLELAASDQRLLRNAAEAGLDVVVVDEAHRLFRAEYADALRHLVSAARHALLLTATPLSADRRGFFELLSLLHPDSFQSFEAFEKDLAAGGLKLACTSAVRRADVGGLQPRIAVPVDVAASPKKAKKAKKTRSAKSTKATSAASSTISTTSKKRAVDDTLRDDPRTRWLVEQVPLWTAAREKCLVFVRELEVLEELVRVVEAETQTRVTVFHEELSAGKRDIEVAAFRESAVPLLISTEAGGEGRNFQFCHRMLHFDLPLDPVALEQRIGRLDRIGRTSPVEILYFRKAGAEGDTEPDIARLYERLDLFERPAAGLDSALSEVRHALEQAREEATPLDVDALVQRVERARGEANADLTQVFYTDAYRAEQAEDILEQVPKDLEQKTRDFCVEAAEDLGFECLEKGGVAEYYIEFGSGAKIDALPGVEGGARFLGTFDRAEAVAKEEIDFFASGHALVEGLLLELEDGNRGRAALLELPAGSVATGLVCVYKNGPEWQLSIVEADGTPRPEWREKFLNALPKARRARPEQWGISEQWADGLRALAERAEGEGEIVAAAFFRPSGGRKR